MTMTYWPFLLCTPGLGKAAAIDSRRTRQQTTPPDPSARASARSQTRDSELYHREEAQLLSTAHFVLV